MQNTTTILLAYDDTDSGERALAYAADLAGASGARLVVTSVAPVLMSVGRRGGLIDIADPPERHLAALDRARTYLSEHGLSADYVPAVGPVADTIVDVANEHGTDLIVVGSDNTNRLKRLFGPPVSASVMNKARCSVFVVRATGTPALEQQIAPADTHPPQRAAA